MLSESPQVPAQGTCPFCGLATGVPHETQQACIDALQVEIARMRDILDHSESLESLKAPPERPDDPTR